MKKVPVMKQVRFLPLPDHQLQGSGDEGSHDGESPPPTRATNSSEPAMRGRGGEDLSRPRNASGGGEQNDKRFLPYEQPPYEQQVCTLLFPF